MMNIHQIDKSCKFDTTKGKVLKDCTIEGMAFDLAKVY